MNFFELFNDPQSILSIILGIITFVICSILKKIFDAIKVYLKRISILKVWNDSKIQYMYDNQASAMNDMYKKAKAASNKIYVFANYADMFDSNKQQMLSLLSKKKKGLIIKFLVLNPYLEVAQYWADEAPDYIERIKGAIKRYSSNDTIQLALHNEKSRFRVYIFDDVMYLGFRLKMEGQEKEKHCADLPIWKISKDSYLYKAFHQQFDDLWEEYNKPTPLTDNKAPSAP